MKPVQIGVDIGSHKIRIATMDTVMATKATGCYDISDYEDRADYEHDIKKAISDFTKKNKIRRYKLNLTLPLNNEMTLVNVLTLPTMDKKIIELSILNEIENTSFVEISKYAHKWGILEKGERELKVISSLINKDYLKLLNSIKNVQTIEIQPVTVGRLIKGNAVYIDFGHQSTRVYAYEEGLPVEIHVIDAGGDNLISGLMAESSVGFDYEGAKNTLEQISITGEDDASLYVNEEVKEISGEVKRLIRSIEINRGLEIDNVYYDGGLFNMGDFLEFMKIDLGYPLRKLELLQDEGEEQFILSASSALAGEYNYLPMLNYYERNTITINYTSVAVVTLVLVATVITGNTIVDKRYGSLINKADTQYNEIYSKQISAESDLSQINETIEEKLEELGKLEALKDKKNWLADPYQVITKKTPKSIVVKELVAEKEHFIIHGTATEYKDIGYYAMNLEEYGSIRIDDIKTEEEEINFEISVIHSGRIKEVQ